jgi:hypothetical protein
MKTSKGMLMNTSQQKPRKVLILTACGLIVATGATWGIWAWSRTREANPSKLPGEYSVEALQTQTRNPAQAMETVNGLVQREDLTDEQRREAFENLRKVREARFEENIDEYFAAAPEERNAVLDRQIDEWQQFMKEMEKHRDDWRQARERMRENQNENQNQSNESRRDRGRSRFRTREGRQAFSEGHDPDRTARRMSYFSAMRKRMSERGIEMPGPGRGRPGDRGQGQRPNRPGGPGPPGR